MRSNRLWACLPFIPACGALLLSGMLGCKAFELKVFSNVGAPAALPAKNEAPKTGAARTPPGTQEGAPAVLQQRGFKFWLIAEEKRTAEGSLVKEKYDILKLRPHAYMIGFIQQHPQAGGAAFCRLEAGRLYSFEVTGQEYMPKSGSYVLRGRCIPQGEAASGPAAAKTESK